MSRTHPRPYPGKRLFDLGLLVLSSPVWIPALAILGLLVRIKLGRPVLFRQQRPGRNAVPFYLLKFRTMTNQRSVDGSLLPDDQRMTPFGRALRATSLDELPELLNILRGEMSFVGPRPLLPQYLPLYSERHQQRHLVPPGLSGLAQISGRNRLSWPERFQHDVRYVESNDVFLDIRILLSTLVAVFRRDGISAEGEATMSAFAGYGSVEVASPASTELSKRPSNDSTRPERSLP